MQFDRLKNSGLKATLPRLQIIEIFKTSESRHISAEDVYRQLLALEIDLSLATIYRVLSQFEQAGVLKKRQLGRGKSIYELNDDEENHGHVVSISDGSVHEFVDGAIALRLAEIARNHGLEMTDYVVTVFGHAAQGNG